MSNFFNFSSNDFFLGTTYKNKNLSDKDNFLSVLKNNNLDIKYIADAKQVHSNIVLHTVNPGNYQNLDGLITNRKSRLILVIKTADCIPIFIFDTINKNYGIIHAGWKGIANKIHMNAIKSFLKIGSKINNLNVIMGPSIKSCCYEVSSEMCDIFDSSNIVKNYGKNFLNLNNCIASDIQQVGVKNILINNICTYENEKCYSYRKNNNGRMYSFITLI